MGRKGKEVKQNQSSTQRKLTPTNPRVMRKKISGKKKNISPRNRRLKRNCQKNQKYRSRKMISRRQILA